MDVIRASGDNAVGRFCHTFDRDDVAFVIGKVSQTSDASVDLSRTYDASPVVYQRCDASFKVPQRCDASPKNL